MATSLKSWIATDVAPFRDRSVAWLSQHHFFRDPIRPTYCDNGCFFSPADGVILYQAHVQPDDPIVDIKGCPYSLRDALRDPHFDAPSLVIGVFMTFFDVHVNRVPYPGHLSYRELDPIHTHNQPMLDVEKGILDELRIATEAMQYLHDNQRIVNRIFATGLDQYYYVLQIADYDVDCITPFTLKQNQAVDQGERFSQIRYGSQVDLVIPLSDRFEFTCVQQPGMHVEAGVDPLVRITEKFNTGKEQP